MTKITVETEERAALLVRLPRRMHRALRLLAFERERSINSAVVEAVDRFLAAEQSAQPAGDTRAG